MISRSSIPQQISKAGFKVKRSSKEKEEKKRVKMATSGTNSFNLDVDQVIEEAFERCGLYSRSGYDIKVPDVHLILCWLNGLIEVLIVDG